MTFCGKCRVFANPVTYLVFLKALAALEMGELGQRPHYIQLACLALNYAVSLQPSYLSSQSGYTNNTTLGAVASLLYKTVW